MGDITWRRMRGVMSSGALWAFIIVENTSSRPFHKTGVKKPETTDFNNWSFISQILKIRPLYLNYAVGVLQHIRI